MSGLGAALRWLVADTDGHAALALLCLAACAVGARFGLPHADAGIRAFGTMLLLKLKT
jgi:hypothetical protein